MSSSHGKFVWYELMTTDTKAAEAFYKAVMGWEAQDAGMPDMAYSLLSLGGSRVGGLMALPDEVRKAGGQPGWLGYVFVDDLAAAVAQVSKAGGKIHRPPADIPGVGSFSVVADPQGAVLALFHGAPAPGQEPPPDPAPGTPGHPGWHELHAGDQEAAFGFYAGLFGWTKADPVDMGAMGIYQIFARGGVMMGGMMTKTAATPAPFWLYYVNVAGIDAAAARVTAAGGKVANGPMEVPGGSWIVQCFDPQGAMFALVGPKG
jgi:predicted enzyme related to lactoylglutathione lyase